MKPKHQNQNSILNALFFTTAFFFVCVALGLINPTTANAQDTSSLQGNGMGLLENEWIKVGVNKDRGTFGSGDRDRIPPSFSNSDYDIPTPGLLFDAQGTGNFNPTYDYLSHNNDTSNQPHDGLLSKWMEQIKPITISVAFIATWVFQNFTVRVILPDR